MDGEAVLLTDGSEITMCRTSGVQVIFCVHFEEGGTLDGFERISIVLGFEADAGTSR
jgi:hypothetical protein